MSNNINSGSKKSFLFAMWHSKEKGFLRQHLVQTLRPNLIDRKAQAQAQANLLTAIYVACLCQTQGQNSVCWLEVSQSLDSEKLDP